MKNHQPAGPSFRHELFIHKCTGQGGWSHRLASTTVPIRGARGGGRLQLPWPAHVRCRWDADRAALTALPATTPTPGAPGSHGGAARSQPAPQKAGCAGPAHPIARAMPVTSPLCDSGSRPACWCLPHGQGRLPAARPPSAKTNRQAGKSCRTVAARPSCRTLACPRHVIQSAGRPDLGGGPA